MAKNFWEENKKLKNGEPCVILFFLFNHKTVLYFPNYLCVLACVTTTHRKALKGKYQTEMGQEWR